MSKRREHIVSRLSIVVGLLGGGTVLIRFITRPWSWTPLTVASGVAGSLCLGFFWAIIARNVPPVLRRKRLSYVAGLALTALLLLITGAIGVGIQHVPWFLSDMPTCVVEPSSILVKAFKAQGSFGSALRVFSDLLWVTFLSTIFPLYLIGRLKSDFVATSEASENNNGVHRPVSSLTMRSSDLRISEYISTGIFVAIVSFFLAGHEAIKIVEFPAPWFAVKVWLQGAWLILGWCAIFIIALSATRIGSMIDWMFDKQIQSEIISRWAREATTDDIHASYSRELILGVLQQCGKTNAGHILSLGCGECKTDKIIWVDQNVVRFASYTGVDREKEAQEHANEYLRELREKSQEKQAEYVQAKIEEGLTRLDNGKRFDVITIIQTLPFLIPSFERQKCQIAKLMDTVNNLLAPDGLFLLVDEFPQNWVHNRQDRVVEAWVFGLLLWQSPLGFVKKRAKEARLTRVRLGSSICIRSFETTKYKSHVSPLRVVVFQKRAEKLKRRYQNELH